jgi:hypothetical protein
MVLALAFLTMGAMDYYANYQVEDKEYEAEMRKASKQGLLNEGDMPINIDEECVPSGNYGELNDDENIVGAWPNRVPGDPLGEKEGILDGPCDETQSSSQLSDAVRNEVAAFKNE